MENPREVQRRTKKKEDPCWPVHGPRFLQMDISPLCGGHLCWVGTTPNAYSIYLSIGFSVGSSWKKKEKGEKEKHLDALTLPD